MNLNIVLVEPEIPQNTGNIARTCAAIGAKLHLVKPLGFEITDKYLKRAGLDYWDKLEIEEHNNLDTFLNKYKPKENNMYFVTTKGKHCYSDFIYSILDNILYCLYNINAEDEWTDYIELRKGGVNIEVSKTFLMKLINPNNCSNIYYIEGIPNIDCTEIST